MKILVYPHDMAMGGSQLNALELAAAVRTQGHDVTIVGRTGVLKSRIDEMNLEFIELPPPGRRPSRRVVLALKSLVRERGIDIVHGYEWPPALEALLTCTGTPATPITTVLSMAVAPFIPRNLPLEVGTQQIAELERNAGRKFVRLMEPPVDIEGDRSTDNIPLSQIAQKWGIKGDALTLVIVSRLAKEMKLEGILAAIRLIRNWESRQKLQLVIVGSGPAWSDVREAASEANSFAGEEKVILTGEVIDPRWAYAMADIVLGMGGSALRGMAMGKPLIVQGEKGYWKTLDHESIQEFLWQGWYGVGHEGDVGEMILKKELLPLVRSPELRERLGQYSRTVVQNRFSLEGAATRQIHYYQEARIAWEDRKKIGLETLRSGSSFLGYKFRRFGERICGTMTSDDFNAMPVAAQWPQLRDSGPR